MVKLYTPPEVGAVPVIFAVPTFALLVPGVNVTHVGRPAAVTAGFGVPPVVILNVNLLPAATLVEDAEVIVAEFDEGTTLFEAPDAAPVPSPLVAFTVKV
jgi:hypothetical protein